MVEKKRDERKKLSKKELEIGKEYELEKSKKVKEKGEDQGPHIK